MAYYILNAVTRERRKGRRWTNGPSSYCELGCGASTQTSPCRNALAAGDLVLTYLGTPRWEFIGRAELASAVSAWTESEATLYPGDASSGVLLAQVEEWDPPVPMQIVLSNLEPTAARADFEAGVVRITAHEYGPSSRRQPGASSSG